MGGVGWVSPTQCPPLSFPLHGNSLRPNKQHTGLGVVHSSLHIINSMEDSNACYLLWKRQTDGIGIEQLVSTGQILGVHSPPISGGRGVVNEEVAVTGETTARHNTPRRTIHHRGADPTRCIGHLCVNLLCR